MSEPAQNGRNRVSVANAIALVAMAGSLAGVWASLAADGAKTSQRIVTLEKQRDEDRREAKEDRRDIKESVKSIDSNVQLILRQLEVIQSQRRER